MNYYDTLGIPWDANEDQIKKAYRKLAKKHHPDAGGEQEKFYEISQAYQTLIDPYARQDYDFTLELNDQPVENEQSYYDSIKNSNVIVSCQIDLEDVFTGKKVDITYKLLDDSINCVTVYVPAGVKNGDILVVENAGESYIQGNPRGDLMIKVKIKHSSKFSRNENDLITTHHANALDLITGCDIVCEVPYHGRISLDIPAGTQSESVFSLPGYGFPDINTGKSGSLYVKILASIPSIDDEKILEKLRTIRHITAKDTQPWKQKKNYT